MSKKILSLALAVVMLVSVFAFTASATTTTFPETGKIGYRVVSNAYVNMPAGEEVTVEVYFVLPDGTDESFRLVAHNIPFCYNSAYFSFNGFELGDYYADGIFTATDPNTTIFNTLKKAFTDVETAKGYDSAVQLQMKLDGSSEYTSTTGFKPSEYSPIFKLSFTTEDTLDANAIIGIPASAVAKQFVPQYKNGTKNVKYGVDNTVLSEHIIDSDTMYLDVSDAQSFLLRNNADDANSLDVGVMATFMDDAFPVTFTGKTCNELDNIGIEARINGEVETGLESAELNYIYRNATDNGYDFVGAITNIPASDLDTKIEIRAYFIANGTTYYSNWVAVKANLRYDDAVFNGMSAIA